MRLRRSGRPGPRHDAARGDEHGRTRTDRRVAAPRVDPRRPRAAGSAGAHAALGGARPAAPIP
ncbi:hypothetical protein D8M33_10845, partial [Micrococcus sp. HSID17245]